MRSKNTGKSNSPSQIIRIFSLPVFLLFLVLIITLPPLPSLLLGLVVILLSLFPQSSHLPVLFSLSFSPHFPYFSLARPQLPLAPSSSPIQSKDAPHSRRKSLSHHKSSSIISVAEGLVCPSPCIVRFTFSSLFFLLCLSVSTESSLPLSTTSLLPLPIFFSTCSFLLSPFTCTCHEGFWSVGYLMAFFFSLSIKPARYSCLREWRLPFRNASSITYKNNMIWGSFCFFLSFITYI